MDIKILSHKIDASMFRRNIENIQSLKDIYKDITYRDLTNLNLKIYLESKSVFEWIIVHPDYDYKALIHSDYSNEILYNYFKIYYEEILFLLERFFKEDYIIKPSDFDEK